VRPLTDTEAGQVLEACTSRPTLQRFALRLLLQYRLTAHEVSRLRLDSIDGSSLTVKNKCGELRTVALDAAALADVDEVLRDHPGGQLLAGSTGALRPDALRRLMRSAVVAAGIKDEISIHRSRRVVDVRA
jgi:integrase